MDSTPQIFFKAARQIGQPEIVARFSASLGAMLVPPGMPFVVVTADIERQQVERQRARNQGAIALIESWLAENATMNRDEQQAALAEWAQLQQLLDEEYLADSPLLP